MKVNRDQVVAMIEEMAAAMAQNKEYLTELDSAIGDADHGINMDRGFRKVLEKLPPVADKDIGTIFKNVAMSSISLRWGERLGPSMEPSLCSLVRLPLVRRN